LENKIEGKYEMGEFTKFVDRKDHLEYFDKLLRFEDEVRVLAVQDNPGMGKTYFLKKLKNYCQTLLPRVSVALIDLQQLEDTSPSSFLQEVWESLKDNNVQFPMYEEFLNSRDKNINLSVNMSIQDNVFDNVERVNISSTIGDFISNLNTQPINQLSTKEKKDEKTGEQAFLSDVRNYCQDKPIVLLFDHYEHCADEKLKKWIVEHFLGTYFFNAESRPKKLLLVMAGRKDGLPCFKDYWHETVCENIVYWFDKLGPWPFNELERFIKLCQASVDPSEVEQIHGLMKSGMLDIKTLTLLVESRAHHEIR